MEYKYFLDYLYPVLIAVVAFLLTSYFSKRKEYIRIKSLKSYVLIWLLHINKSIRKQAKLLFVYTEELKRNKTKGDYLRKEELHLDTILNLPSTDLLQVFVHFQQGNGNKNVDVYVSVLHSLRYVNNVMISIKDLNASMIEFNRSVLSDFKEIHSQLAIEINNQLLNNDHESEYFDTLNEIIKQYTLSTENRPDLKAELETYNKLTYFTCIGINNKIFT